LFSERLVEEESVQITSFGLFWRASEIDWDPDSQRRLLGWSGTKRAFTVCDFNAQEGVYILYNNHGPYYVGLTEKLGLGWRLRSHYKRNQRAGKWDRFSWFGFKGVSRRPIRGVCSLQPGDDEVTTSKRTTIGDLEALLIFAMGTQSNNRTERFSEALCWSQISCAEREEFVPAEKP
jgi:hypothetical protein